MAQTQDPKKHEDKPPVHSPTTVLHTSSVQHAAAAPRLPAAHAAAHTGGVSAVSLDHNADQDFAKLWAKDQHAKNPADAVAQDVSRLMSTHIGAKYDEELFADANRHGALAQTIEVAGANHAGLPSTLVAAVNAGAIPGQDVINAAAKTPGSSLVTGAAQQVTQMAVTNLNSAKSNYESAVGNKRQLDAQLAAELARVGPGLTDAQRQRFTQDFQKEHDYTGAEAAIDRASQQLDSTMHAELPTLEAAIKNPPDAKGARLDAKLASDAALGGLEAVATSSNAADALQVRHDLINDKSLRDTMRTADPGKYQEAMDGSVKALETVAAKLLAEHNAGQQADAKTKQTILDMANTIQSDSELISRSQDGLGAIQALKSYWFPDAGQQKKLTADQAVMTKRNGEVATAQRKVDTLQNDLKIWKATGETAKYQQGIKELPGLQTELKTAQHEANDAKEAFYELKNGPLEAFEKSAVKGGAGVLKEALGAIGLMDFALDPQADIGKMAHAMYNAGTAGSALGLFADAEKGMSLTDRLIPGVGLAASTAAFWSDIHSGTVGGDVAAAGDALSAVGSLLEATGTVGDLPGAAIGAVLDAVGTGVSFVGNTLFGSGDPVGSDAQGLLQKQGIDARTAAGLGHADAGVTSALANMGVSRQQIDGEAATTPLALDDTRTFGDLQRAQQALGIKSQNWDAMVHAMVGDEQRLDPGADANTAVRLVRDRIEQDLQAADMQAVRKAEGEGLSGQALIAKERQLVDQTLAADLDVELRDVKSIA